MKTSSTNMTIYTKRLIAIAAAVIALAWAAELRADQQSEPRPLAKVSLRLPWLFNDEAAGIFEAQERGYFRDEGIDLKIDPGGVGLDPAQLVNAGSDEIGICDGAALIIARSRGLPLKGIAAEYQQSPLCYVTLGDSGIKTVKDFKGHKIGTQLFQRYVLETMLAANGMTLTDVTVVPVQFDVRPLTDGQVDAFLSFSTDEPILLGLKGVKTHVILAADNGYPFYANVVFTTDKFLKEKPELLKHFLQAMFRGWREAIVHPDDAAALVVSKYNKDLDMEHQKRGMALIAKIVVGDVGPDRIGIMSRSRWEKSINTLLKYKQIDNAVSPEDVYTTQILDSIYGK